MLHANKGPTVCWFSYSKGRNSWTKQVTIVKTAFYVCAFWHIISAFLFLHLRFFLYIICAYLFWLICAYLFRPPNVFDFSKKKYLTILFWGDFWREKICRFGKKWGRFFFYLLWSEVHMYNQSRLIFCFACLREQYQTHDYLFLVQWYKHQQNSEINQIK